MIFRKLKKSSIFNFIQSKFNSSAQGPWRGQAAEIRRFRLGSWSDISPRASGSSCPYLGQFLRPLWDLPMWSPFIVDGLGSRLRSICLDGALPRSTCHCLGILYFFLQKKNRKINKIGNKSDFCQIWQLGGSRWVQNTPTSGGNDLPARESPFREKKV